MSAIIAFLFFFVAVLIVCGVLSGAKRDENGAGGVPGSDDVNELSLDADGVLFSLVSVLRSLERQRAGGYRSWLSSCIERLHNGYDVPPEVALQALYFTRSELAGSRFDLRELDARIADFEEKLGVGE